MENWYTLAHSKVGTHVMRFREKLEKADAEAQGQKDCLENGRTYIGTFDKLEIYAAEKKFRKEHYHEDELREVSE